jgi:hypothetical protein
VNNELTLFGDTDIQQKTWHIGLSDELVSSLRQDALDVKTIFVQATLALGKKLAEANAKLAYKNGGFVKWAKEEAGLDHERAYEYIRIWDGYKMLADSANISEIGKSVLIASSREDVPESARKEIVTRHEAGEKITLKVSDEIIERHKAEVAALQSKTRQLEIKLADEQETVRVLELRIDDYESRPEPKPERVEVPVIPPETQAKIEQLEGKVSDLTQKNKNRYCILL